MLSARSTRSLLGASAFVLGACAEHAQPSVAPSGSQASSSAPALAGAARSTVRPIALPGATGAVSLDYLAVDRAAGRVWVPAGDTGSVDVIDTATYALTRIQGFPTVEKAGRSGKRVVGPSSATIGVGVAYVGNRANGEVCAVSLTKLERGACLTLPFAPDGLAYVAATQELWATTPADKSITVLDASTPGKLAPKTRIALEGEPEGYAVDQAKGVFYTNLEDGDRTLVLDARAHRVVAAWEPHCGEKGPRGLALDAAKGFLFVACTDHVKVLDIARAGAELGALRAGAGIDNIDYVEQRAQLFIAAGGAGTLTVAHVDDKGALAVVGTTPTAPGARVVVAGASGVAYVADGRQGRVLVVTPSP